MLVANTQFINFWLTPWSDTFRAACLWFTPETQPLRGRSPDSVAPDCLRPLLLQRWVGQAIGARLAANPDTSDYRYERESEPCWEAAAWASYDRRLLRLLREERLLWLFWLEVERLLRIAQEHPSLVGGLDWTGAALCASEHIAQVYGELKRRHKAMRARAILREELRCFVAWQACSALLL
ncbi:MAG TPA: hypothetical protein VKT82_26595 [Ktedonobacterales bacterium]|nr:hypothetical protein [Ktedonobacterales bacterium]